MSFTKTYRVLALVLAFALCGVLTFLTHTTGLIFGVILADVDLLALLGRAARVHDEAFAFHRIPSSAAPCRGAV